MVHHAFIQYHVFNESDRMVNGDLHTGGCVEAGSEARNPSNEPQQVSHRESRESERASERESEQAHRL